MTGDYDISMGIPFWRISPGFHRMHRMSSIDGWWVGGRSQESENHQRLYFFTSFQPVWNSFQTIQQANLRKNISNRCWGRKLPQIQHPYLKEHFFRKIRDMSRFCSPDLESNGVKSARPPPWKMEWTIEFLASWYVFDLCNKKIIITHRIHATGMFTYICINLWCM